MSNFVGREAPDFTGHAIMPDGRLSTGFRLRDYLGGQSGFLCFYAQDFFYLCPAELLALQSRLPDFAARNIKPIAISIDSHLSHARLRELPMQFGGIGKIGFPLVGDISKIIVKGYDLLINDTISLRGSILIDNDFVVRYAATYDLPIGRNFDEVLRVHDALQHHQKTGMLCPPGWLAGEPAIPANSNGMIEYLAKHKATV